MHTDSHRYAVGPCPALRCAAQADPASCKAVRMHAEHSRRPAPGCVSCCNSDLLQQSVNQGFLCWLQHAVQKALLRLWMILFVTQFQCLNCMNQLVCPGFPCSLPAKHACLDTVNSDVRVKHESSVRIHRAKMPPWLNNDSKSACTCSPIRSRGCDDDHSLPV